MRKCDVRENRDEYQGKSIKLVFLLNRLKICVFISRLTTQKDEKQTSCGKSTLHVTHVRFFQTSLMFTLNYLCFVCTFSIEVRKSVEKLMKFYLLRPTYHFYVIWSHSSTHQVGHSKLRRLKEDNLHQPMTYV